jgi:hypothetical protein
MTIIQNINVKVLSFGNGDESGKKLLIFSAPNYLPKISFHCIRALNHPVHKHALDGGINVH